jgi:hypothetical protein
MRYHNVQIYIGGQLLFQADNVTLELAKTETADEPLDVYVGGKMDGGAFVIGREGPELLRQIPNELAVVVEEPGALGDDLARILDGTYDGPCTRCGDSGECPVTGEPCPKGCG